MVLDNIDNQISKFYRKLIQTKDEFLKKLIQPLARLGIPADIVSFLGLISGIISAFYISSSRIYFFLFWAGKHLADIVDGPLSKLNRRKLITSFDVDRFCDDTYSFILYIVLIPVIGFWLPVLSIVSHGLHLLLHYDKVRKSMFAPASIAQPFFVLGFLKLGVIIQVLYSGFSTVYLTIRHKRSV